MPVCAIEGCGKPARGHGWCSAHYQRWRTHGDPLAGRTAEAAHVAYLAAAERMFGAYARAR